MLNIDALRAADDLLTLLLCLRHRNAYISPKLGHRKGVARTHT